MTTAKAVYSRSGGYSVIHRDHRSGLEDKVSEQLKDADIEYEYEQYYLQYEIPAKTHKYTPDFVLANGIIIETKGIFDVDDRQKHLLIKQQYPYLDIRFVFTNSKTKISKQSKTTYASWCEKHGFLYSDKYIPSAWLAEEAKAVDGLTKRKQKGSE